jgi:L-alanine-DL-glutamate epimerase-like enolase superfamily enzyme
MQHNPGTDSITTVNNKKISVVLTGSEFEREKLLRPFGFKGGYLTELWQCVTRLQSVSGISKIGLATQSVLYGDANLFAANTEAVGNNMMYLTTNHALELVKQTSFTTPVDLLEKILPTLTTQAKIITQKPDLHINFIYNALVSVDNAAWLLYAAENQLGSFSAMLPQAYQKALAHRNKKIAIMYQVHYGTSINELKTAAQQGYFVFKIKTGHAGTQDEMLAADITRLSQIHNALKDLRTTQTGKIMYTMDANGRYQQKATLQKYLDHAKKIGAFEHILLYEEPFDEQNTEHVADLGVRIAVDESVYDEATARQKIALGYRAIVLKGIAKTLSVSLKIAKLAAENNIPCLCSDLTVNPILIDWHKNLAGHLAPFPGIGMGLMETNGDMNYRNWDSMLSYHPLAGAEWTKVKNGVFELTDDFYKTSGGIFEPSAHYEALFTTS